MLAPNIPAMYEMQFAVPMAGLVLNNINTMLDANTVKTILRHSESKLFFVDYEYMSLATNALRLLKANFSRVASQTTPLLPVLIIINELGFSCDSNFDQLRSQDFKGVSLM